MNQQREHVHELSTLVIGQRIQHTALGTQHRRLCPLQQLLPVLCQCQQPHTAVYWAGIAQHQATRFQSIDDATYRGSIEANGARQRALIHAWLTQHSRQRGVLHGRNREFLGLFHEHGHRNLLQAANVIAGIVF